MQALIFSFFNADPIKQLREIVDATHNRVHMLKDMPQTYHLLTLLF
jgi:hypothetical protein